MEDILAFLSELSLNNNREWFNEHKDRYLRCKKLFEAFTASYIEGLQKIDSRIGKLSPSDCIWRIYRDVRFSHDKRPYKEWFGTFPAPLSGKRSPMAGYYCHIQPGQSMFAAGIWGPDNKLLYHLRSDINDNGEELEQIMNKREFKKLFRDFDSYYMLKKTPLGFDPKSPYSEWIKRKSFTVSTIFTDEEVCHPNFLQHILDVANIAKPLNDFLNYSFEQYIENKE